ncbi:hypothetical protein BKA83DRAFT_4326063, partial [Pisolithus microcarpus]
MHRRCTPFRRSILFPNLISMTHSNSLVIVDSAFNDGLYKTTRSSRSTYQTTVKFPICRKRASSSKKVCWFCSRGTFARGTLSPSRYHRIFRRAVVLTLCSQIPQIFLDSGSGFALTHRLSLESRHAEPCAPVFIPACISLSTPLSFTCRSGMPGSAEVGTFAHLVNHYPYRSPLITGSHL